MIVQQKQFGAVIAVTVSDIGISHRLSNKPNQDAASFEIEEEDFVLAVSDGVGSCVNATLGSQMAVQAASNAFEALQREELALEKDEVVDFIIKEWLSLLEDKKPDQCCATLKTALKKGTSVLMLSIGDGLLAISSSGLSMIAPTEENEFANQTSCLNAEVCASDFWGSKFQIDYHVSYVVLACTDGVANFIQSDCELQLLTEIEMNTDSDLLKDELVSFITEISDYSFDDKTVGVIKYEWKNAKPNR